MGSRYNILYSNYDDMAWRGSYKSQWLIPAIIAFVRLRFKYDSVNFNWSKP